MAWKVALKLLSGDEYVVDGEFESLEEAYAAGEEERDSSLYLFDD